MTNISARTWVLMGFVISLAAVVINVFVLSGINARMKETDGELSKLNESLRNQATEIKGGEIKSDLSTVLNHMSNLATGKKKTEAAADSVRLLQEYLVSKYAAVNDIPQSELLKVENEDFVHEIPAGEKLVKAFEMSDEAKKIGDEAIKENDDGKLAEAARLSSEAGAMQEESKAMFEKAKQPERNSELGKRKREIENVLDVDVLAEKEQVFTTIAKLPYLKSLNEQFIANYHKKEARIKELQDKKARLFWWASIATYAAISLQLFGLMFVLTKDLTRDKRKE